MIDINNLGTFTDINAVWAAYPEGGNEGDYLYVGTTKYRWDKYERVWKTAGEVTESPARKLVTNYGDMAVNNDLRVGGTLYYHRLAGYDLGLFASLAALQAAHPTPKVGQWAFVVHPTVEDKYQIYSCETAGTWTLSVSETTLDVLGLDQYTELLEMMQAIAAGKTLTGYRIAASTSDLPLESPDPTLGWIVNGHLYVYVGTGGDTQGGLYQDCGQLRGEKGDKGDAGVNLGDDFEAFSEIGDLAGKTTSQKEAMVPDGNAVDEIAELLRKKVLLTSLTINGNAYLSGYVKTTGGANNKVITSSSNGYRLYLYLLEEGKTYYFMKVGDPENAAILVGTLSIASADDFVVGLTIGTIIVKGSDGNGILSYTPEQDTYVCVMGKNSKTNYVSEAYEKVFRDLDDLEGKLDFDQTPTEGSTNAVTSGGVYDALEEIEGQLSYITEYDGDDFLAQRQKFYYTHGKSVGSTPPYLNASAGSTIYTGIFTTKKNAEYKFYAASSASSDYGRPVVICQNNLIVKMATANTVNGLSFTSDSAATVYFNIGSAYRDDFKIEEKISVKERVEQMSGGSDTATFPQMFLPKKIWGVVGDTLDLYRKGIVMACDCERWFLKLEGSGFKSTRRYSRRTPGSAGTTSLSVCLMDEHYKSSTALTASMITKAVPSSPAENINVLCIGASTTVNANAWPVELNRRLVGSGGTPSALGLSNITFVGRKTVKSSTIHCEATGGWHWIKYVNPGVQQIRFYLSDAGTGYIGAKYSFANSNGTVQVQLVEWNVTQGTGNALFDYVSSSDAGKAPSTTSGTLTYVSGGDSSEDLLFTEYEVEAANPFWNAETGAIDIQSYADTYCDGNIDVLIISLTPFNNGIVGNGSLTNHYNAMKTFIDHYHEQFVDGKVIIESGKLPNPYYGIEYNYGGTSSYNTWSVSWMQWRWSQLLDDFCNDDDYSSFCFFADAICEMDTEYAYPTESRAVNPFISSVTELVGTNGAHPSTIGFKMEAAAIYRCFVCNVLS